jgi:hypothetical protein
MSYQEDTPSVEADRRSVRRHHLERIKKNRQGYWGYKHRDEPMTERQLGIVASTPQPCACWSCRNPRKLNGELTLQEQRNHQVSLHEPSTLED